MGCIIGPIVGGALNDLVKFQVTCDVMALTCITYTLIFYFMMRNSMSIGISSEVTKAKVDPPITKSKQTDDPSTEGGGVELTCMIN